MVCLDVLCEGVPLGGIYLIVDADCFRECAGRGFEAGYVNLDVLGFSLSYESHVSFQIQAGEGVGSGIVIVIIAGDCREKA